MANILQSGLHTTESKGCLPTWSAIEEESPTEDLVDAALTKSESLIGSLSKLGISFDADDDSDASTRCGLSPSASMILSPSASKIFSSISSSSDLGDDSGQDDVELERPCSTSPVRAEMGDHVDTVAKLLTLREKVYRLKENADKDGSKLIEQSSDAIVRLETHLQELAKNLSETADKPNLGSRLQRLEGVVELLKQEKNEASNRPSLSTPSKGAASPTLKTRSILTHQPMLRAVSPKGSPVSRMYGIPPARAISPPRATSPGSSPKRLVCQQVAVTRVYNFWSLQD